MPNVSERQVEADIAANELMLNNALNDPVIRALLEEFTITHKWSA